MAGSSFRGYCRRARSGQDRVGSSLGPYRRAPVEGFRNERDGAQTGLESSDPVPLPSRYRAVSPYPARCVSVVVSQDLDAGAGMAQRPTVRIKGTRATGCVIAILPPLSGSAISGSDARRRATAGRERTLGPRNFPVHNY
jgi:hypothetical protein